MRLTRKNAAVGLALLCIGLLGLASLTSRSIRLYSLALYGASGAIEVAAPSLGAEYAVTSLDLAGSDSFGNGTSGNLCYVHQSWRERALPVRFLRWFASWDTCFPEYRHLLWTDSDNMRLVRERSPDLLPQFRAYPHAIQRADAARYLYMYHFGGVYTDLDNECLRSFRHLIEQSGCGVILGSMRVATGQQYIQNSFMYSRRGHPFWLQVLSAMLERSQLQGSYVQQTIDITTGPRLLMHAVGKYAKAYEGTARPGPVCVFPDNYFNPYSWDLDRSGPCRDLNRMTEADLALCKMLHKRAYVLQYHTQSWMYGRV